MGRLPRRFLVAGAILAGLGAGIALGGIVFFPRVGTWVVRAKVVPRLERELGRKVAVGDVAVTRGRVVLKNLVVAGANDLPDAPLAHVASVTADYDFWDTLGGEMRLGHVVVDGLRASVVRHADGSDNLRDLAERLRQRLAGKPSTGAGGDGGSRVSLRPASLVLSNAAFEAVDAAAGVRASAGAVSARLSEDGKIEAELGDVAVTTDIGPGATLGRARITTEMSAPLERAVVEIHDGTVRATRGVTLSAVTGTVTPSGGTALTLDLAGSYGGATEPLWKARGNIDVAARTASIDVAAEQFTFDRLDSVLRDSAVVEYEDTSLGAAMHVEVDPARVVFRGSFRLDGLTVFHPMLATKPARDISVSGDIEGDFDRETRALTVKRGALTAGEVAFQVEGSMHLPGGLEPDGLRRAEPRVAAHLVVPPVPCQSVLAAIPAGMVPYLEGFTLQGTFEADVRLAIDWANLEATELDGELDIFGCRASERGSEDPIAERLAGSFMHYVEEERDVWISFMVGPENPDFVPLAEVSPHILNSFMTTEDSRFYEHKGFIPREFKSALVKNLQAGYFRFGASSITMQTVKNVLLYREKTLARKLQELFLTWYIETQLDKDRIFEIYVNAIEYGPGLYGIGPATRHYFGKHPRDVSPVEAAFLSSILPSPKQRYKQYCEDRLWRSSEVKIQRILTYMHERERLTDEEYEAARATPLVFDRAEAGPERECKRMVRRAIENARPTNPMAK